MRGASTDATDATSGKRSGKRSDAPEWKAPDLVESALEAGQVVRLRFAPVISRLASHDFSAAPFRVEDAEGEVPIAKVVYFHRDSVKLFLARPPRGRALVSCGHGEDPDALPMDVERQLPVLAFDAVPALA
jgi:hypothetical protein